MWTQTLAGRSALSQGPIFALRKSSAPLLLDWVMLLATTPAAIPDTMKRATAAQASVGCSTGKTSFLVIFDVARVM